MQRRTRDTTATHENCLTLLSEALKEEVMKQTASGEDGSTSHPCSRFRNGEPPSNAGNDHGSRCTANVAASATANLLQHHANASKAAACATVNHHQNTPQNQTKTHEALKEEVITLPRQRPDCIWSHLIQCSRFRNGEPPSNAPRHHRQGSKPPSERPRSATPPTKTA